MNLTIHVSGIYSYLREHGNAANIRRHLWKRKLKKWGNDCLSWLPLEIMKAKQKNTFWGGGVNMTSAKINFASPNMNIFDNINKHVNWNTAVDNMGWGTALTQCPEKIVAKE